MLDHLNIIETIVRRKNIREARFKDVPLWMKKSIKLYVLRVTQRHIVYMIKPLKKLSYEQLAKLYRISQKRSGGIVFIIADEINPKYRSLFVRQGISFVYNDESVFSPELSVKLLNMRKSEMPTYREIRHEISPFELKLLSGFLTNFIPRIYMNLDECMKILINNKYKCTKSKLSMAIKSLYDRDIIDVKGSGPNRRFEFPGKDKIWEELNELPIKNFYKIVEGYSVSENKKFISGGELALSSYSDLSNPSIKCFAITNKDLIKKKKKVKRAEISNAPNAVYHV